MERQVVVFYRGGEDSLIRATESWRQLPESEIHNNFVNDTLTVLDGERARDGYLWLKISGFGDEPGWTQDDTVNESSFATWKAQKELAAATAKEERKAAAIEAQEAEAATREALSASISEKLDALGLSAEEIAYITTGAI